MQKFSFRKYISTGLALSFLMIIISGLVLYIAPPGRIARWMGWVLIWLDRSQWETQHTLFSYLFILFGIIHLFSMNWRAFLSYIGKKRDKRFLFRKEPALALATITLIFVLTLLKIPPVISVMDLGNSLSDLWEENIGGPPAPGIEEMTLDEISGNFFNSDDSLVINQIRSSGFLVNSVNQTLKDIAANNSVSPMLVFRSLHVKAATTIEP